MPFPIPVQFSIPELFHAAEVPISICTGLTVLVGPNGSGKTQVMRRLREVLRPHVSGRKVRYLSPGRLAHMEDFRSNFDGMRGETPRYENIEFGAVGYRSYRHEAETAYGDFHTLSIRQDLQVKVAAILKSLFQRDIHLDWDAGMLKPRFSRLDSDGRPYSGAREASGLLHLVVALAALYDDEVGALLVDEPEVSLHPQLQSFLLREVKRVAGDPAFPDRKLVVLATHSTEMVEVRKPEDLNSIVFFQDVDTLPVQVSPDAPELRDRKLSDLLMRMGHSHKAALFCSRPLMVEGPSDEIVLNAVADRLDLFLGPAGAQIVPVLGKGQVAAVVKLMRLIGKDPAVLVDLDGFSDDVGLCCLFAGSDQARQAAQDMGHTDLCAFARSVHSDLCREIDEHWSDIVAVAQHTAYWAQQDPQQDEGIRRRRTGLAAIINSSEQDGGTWPNRDIWLGLRRRLIRLFDTLERNGFFVLRRGVVENYYQQGDPMLLHGKPQAAVEEADYLSTKDQSFVREHYPDLVRVLEFCSRTPRPIEAATVARLLLAVAAPALNELGESTSEADLQSLSRAVLGDKSTLFRLRKVALNAGLGLEISLSSSVLRIAGFPFTVSKNDDLRLEVNHRILESSASWSASD